MGAVGCGVFAVIEDEVAHLCLLGEHGDVAHGVVVLLVGLESFAVGIAAEGAAEQEVGAAHIVEVGAGEGFVAEACKGCAGGNTHDEACLCHVFGADIEEFDGGVGEGCVGVSAHGVEVDYRAHELEVRLEQGDAANGEEARNDVVIAVEVEFALVAAFACEVDDCAHKPYRTEYVVGMGVSDHEVVYLRRVYTAGGESADYAVASARICKPYFALEADCRAGVVAASGKCAAGADEGEAGVSLLCHDSGSITERRMSSRRFADFLRMSKR